MASWLRAVGIGTLCSLIYDAGHFVPTILSFQNREINVRSMERATSCQKILKEEYLRRRGKNANYSLRAFARDLGIGSTTISDALAGKRSLSRKNILKVAQRLALSPTMIDHLMQRRARSKEEIRRLQLEEDTFRLLADWYYLAIMSLAKIEDNSADYEWIAQRLGITVEQVDLAMQRLLRLKLLKIEEGKLIRTSLPLSTSRDIPSLAIRKHHQDNLELAAQSLAKDPLEEREFSSVTMAINPEKLQEAKDFLMKAKRKLSKILAEGEQKEVYTLSYQLFPLTKRRVEEAE